MKTVRYVGPSTPPIAVPAAGAITDDNGVVQVPADVAASLLDQDTWVAGAGKPRPKPQAAPARTAGGETDAIAAKTAPEVTPAAGADTSEED